MSIIGGIFLYIVLYIVSAFGVIAVTGKELFKFIKRTFRSGNKINFEYIGKIMKKYKSKGNIIDLIPGLNILQMDIRARRMFKKVENDLAFVNNLFPLTEYEKSLVENIGKEDNNIFIKLIKYYCSIYAIFKDVKVRYDGTDLGAMTKDGDELNINEDGRLSDAVLFKMKEANSPLKQNNVEKTFYALHDDYSLSEVYRIDENPLFIKSNNNNYAIIDASEEEVYSFFSKGLIVKPDINVKYYVISFKPFDKTKLRKSLLEIEYFKSDDIIDVDCSREEKSRTL